MVLAFAMAPEQRLESQRLLEIAGVASDDAGKHALSVILSRLRAKLNPALDGKLLVKSLRLEGYILCITVSISGPRRFKKPDQRHRTASDLTTSPLANIVPRLIRS